MFNVKRNGASVEITGIPQSIPYSVFKNIADDTRANECLVTYVKDKDSYEVVIRHDNVNIAAAAAWLALEARESVLVKRLLNGPLPGAYSYLRWTIKESRIPDELLSQIG